MRIIHVAPFYAPVIGGVEDVVKHIAEYMAAQGHEVYVITYNRLRRGGVGKLPREEIINGVHVIRLKPTVTWSHGSYSPELPNVIRALRPDIVHVHVWRHPHVFQIAKLKEEVKFKAILHGHAPFHRLSQLDPITWTYHRLVDTLLRSVLKIYDKYVALTNFERQKIIQLELEEEKVVVIPNGVDEDNCKITDERPEKILYLGRISRVKNIKLLVKAMKYVNTQIKSAELTLAGPDEGLIKWIMSYATKNNIRIKYLGVVNEDQKHMLYRTARVYAFPSIYEPLPLTILEAGIHATPSVITGYGGQIDEAPPGKASLWAEPKPEKYSEAIVKLLTDRVLWNKLSKGVYEHVQNYVWNKILPNYNKLYNL